MSDLHLWIAFAVFIVTMMVLDLGVLHRTSREVRFREASLWTGFVIFCAVCFYALLFWKRGGEVAGEFLTGYLVELSLSVDNLFVFILLFQYFKVQPAWQHRVLFWGIIGAFIMRAILIFAAAALIHHFHGLIYVFGAFLIWTGYKMATKGDDDFEPGKNPVLLTLRRLIPVTEDYHGSSFFVRHAGKLMATPLFIVLLFVEFTDLVFALDSIPAIIAFSKDPFILFSSNVFAILGLRSMYFTLAGVMQLFHYLQLGLAAVLTFVGAKMLISGFYPINIYVSLGVIALTLILSVVASLLWPKKDEEEPEAGVA